MSLRSSVLLLTCLLLAACSASTFEYTECSSNEVCREVFGFGSVCTEGLCATAQLNPRCVMGPDEGLSLPLDPATHIPIGSIFNRTTESHLAREQSARMALSQANSGDGLEGRDFVLIQCSNEPGGYDELDQDTANVAVARHLADEIGVPAIVGPSASSRTQSAFVEVESFGTLMISPSATSPALTALDGLEHSDSEPGLLWRTAPPDTIQGPVIAGSMIHRGTVTAAAVHREDAYGSGLALVVHEAFVGEDRTLELLPFNDEAGLVDQTVGAVEEGEVDEVLFVSSNLDEVVGFLVAASTLSGFDGVDIFLTDAAHSQDLLDDAAAAIDELGDIRGTSPALPEGSAYDAFVASYAVAYNEDVSNRSFTAHAYDAAWLVICGSAWSLHNEGEITGLGIARGLREVSAGGQLELQAQHWPTIRASFEAGTSVDVIGASGDLDYDPETGETSGQIEEWQISADGDEFEVIGGS